MAPFYHKQIAEERMNLYSTSAHYCSKHTSDLTGIHFSLCVSGTKHPWCDLSIVHAGAVTLLCAYYGNWRLFQGVRWVNWERKHIFKALMSIHQAHFVIMFELDLQQMQISFRAVQCLTTIRLCISPSRDPALCTSWKIIVILRQADRSNCV